MGHAAGLCRHIHQTSHTQGLSYLHDGLQLFLLDADLSPIHILHDNLKVRKLDVIEDDYRMLALGTRKQLGEVGARGR